MLGLKIFTLTCLLDGWSHQMPQFLELLLAYGTVWVLLQPCVDALIVEQVLAVKQTYILSVFDVCEADNALCFQVYHFVALRKIVHFEVDICLSWDVLVDVELCSTYVLWLLLFVLILYISFLVYVGHIYSAYNSCTVLIC